MSEKIIKCFDLKDKEVRKRLLKVHGNQNENKMNEENMNEENIVKDDISIVDNTPMVNTITVKKELTYEDIVDILDNGEFQTVWLTQRKKTVLFTSTDSKPHDMVEYGFPYQDHDMNRKSGIIIEFPIGAENLKILLRMLIENSAEIIKDNIAAILKR